MYRTRRRATTMRVPDNAKRARGRQIHGVHGTSREPDGRPRAGMYDSPLSARPRRPRPPDTAPPPCGTRKHRRQDRRRRCRRHGLLYSPRRTYVHLFTPWHLFSFIYRILFFHLVVFIISSSLLLFVIICFLGNFVVPATRHYPPSGFFFKVYFPEHYPYVPGVCVPFLIFHFPTATPPSTLS